METWKVNLTHYVTSEYIFLAYLLSRVTHDVKHYVISVAKLIR